MLAADLRHDLVRTVFRSLGSTDASWAATRFEEMQREIATRLPPLGRQETRLGVDLRYTGQTHTVSLALESGDAWTELRARFDAAHARAYGYAATAVEVEVLNLRVSVVSPVERAALPAVPVTDGRLPPAAERVVYSLAAARALPTSIYRREELSAGDVIQGPAAIEEPSTTTILEPGDRLTVDPHGFLVVEIGG